MVKPEHLAVFGEGVELVIQTWLKLPENDKTIIDIKLQKLKKIKEIVDDYKDLPITLPWKIKLNDAILKLEHGLPPGK